MYHEINSIEDVQRLIENNVSEDFYIDYKRELNIDDKRSFLKDVCAFANTYGGQIVYGVEENKGIPTALVGVKLKDADKEILRISSVACDGLEPVVSGLDIKTIQIEENSNNYIIVITIPKSWCPPHRIKLDGHNKFYGRRSARNDELSYLEIRNHFNMANTLKDNFRSFRSERVSDVVNNVTPVQMSVGSKIVLHIMPLSSFSSGVECNALDLKKLMSEHYNWFFPLGATSAISEITLDGLLVYPNIQSIHRAYTHFYREGIIEAVAVLPAREFETERHIICDSIEKYLIKQNYFNLLKSLNFSPPFYVFVSLVNVRGCSLQVSSPGGNQIFNMQISNRTYNKDHILLREFIVDTFTKPTDQLFKSLLDQISNAWGFERCFSFDQVGGYLMG